MPRTKKSKAVARKVPVAGKAPQTSKCGVFQNTMEYDQASPLSPKMGGDECANQSGRRGRGKEKEKAQEVRKDQEKGKEAKEGTTNRSVW